MTAPHHPLPEGAAMNPPYVPTNSSTLRRAAAEFFHARPAPDDEDFAIGCECANPALQIESWGRETDAQPLQHVY
jgi:hypothetical protein